MTRLSKPLLTASLLWLVFALTASRAREFLRSQSSFAFYVGGATIMWLLSFGPELKFFGQQILAWAPSPYRWLTVLPGYDALRVPARFAMLATLCLAAAASLAVAHLSARLTRAGQIVLVTMASLGILADGWLETMPLARGAAPSVLAADVGPGAVLELPLGNPRGDVGSMYRAIEHRHPVVNGFSGYAPPHYELLHFLLRSRDPSILTELAAQGVRHVVVWTNADPDGEWQAYICAYPGATLVKIFHGQAYYRLAAVESRPSPPVAAQVPVARVVAGIGQEETDRVMDGDLTTRWTIGAPQTGAEEEQLIADLGAVRRVSGVDLALGSFRADFPRELSVERSLDGKGWTGLWAGRTAGLVLAGAIEEPIRLPVRVRFGPVEARFVRMRQVGSDPLAFWSVAELAVLGLTEPER